MVYKTEEGRSIIAGKIDEIGRTLPFSGESRFLESERFGRTHCFVTGEESLPPLVLLHGTSANYLSWVGYMAEWRDSYRIYALDLPGQPGLSSPERPPLADMSDWLEESVRALGLGRFYLCGMSLGGWAALRFALDHGETVAALALIAPSGLAAPRISFFLRILPLLFMGESGARRINRIVYGPLAPGAEDEAFGLLVGTHFVPLTENIPLFSPRELESIPFPLYYAGGEKDALLNTKASAAFLKAHAKGAAVNVLPGAGHVILDRAEGIGKFFAGTAPSPGE